MNIKSVELVDLIIEKDVDGLTTFAQGLRVKIKAELLIQGKDVYELSLITKINYNKLSRYIHEAMDHEIDFDSMFKLVSFVNKK